MKIKNVLIIIAILFVASMLSSCADVTSIKNCVTDSPYGFWNGLWHGGFYLCLE